MESKEPITAESFFDDYAKEKLGHGTWFTFTLKEATSVVAEITYKVSHEYAVLFAKHHREKAIEAVKDLDVIQELYVEIGSGKIREIEEAIENAYDESKIV